MWHTLLNTLREKRLEGTTTLIEIAQRDGIFRHSEVEAGMRSSPGMDIEATRAASNKLKPVLEFFK